MRFGPLGLGFAGGLAPAGTRPAEGGDPHSLPTVLNAETVPRPSEKCSRVLVRDFLSWRAWKRLEWVFQPSRLDPGISYRVRSAGSSKPGIAAVGLLMLGCRMPQPPPHSDGSPGRPGVDELTRTLYDALKREARRARRRSNPGDTMSTTAVVHEAYARLAQASGGRWNDRAHFVAFAAKTMRSVLVDYVRRQRAAKRGKGAAPVTLDESVLMLEQADVDVIALDEALTQLETVDARKARVVELRFLVGLSVPEIAGVLDVSIATVERDWKFAKAWLARELRSTSGIHSVGSAAAEPPGGSG